MSTVNCAPCCNMQMFYFTLSYFKTKQTRLPNESCKTAKIFRLAALTYRWARQASTRSSCCAAGPGSSEWLAPYPGSCWASPSTAPYLPRDKYARSSLILLSSGPPAHNERSAVQRREGKKKKKPPKKEEVWEKVREMCARRLSGAFACKVELDSGTLGAILWIRSRWRTRGEQFLFCASTTSEKNKSPAEVLNIIIYYSDCWQKQTEAAFCWVRIPDVWPLNPANSI